MKLLKILQTSTLLVVILEIQKMLTEYPSWVESSTHSPFKKTYYIKIVKNYVKLDNKVF